MSTMDTIPNSSDLLAVMDAARQIHATMDRLDALLSGTLGVNRSDLRCLIHLSAQGDATPREIAAATGLTSGSVTALLDRLERQGLTQRRHDCMDRRSVTIAIPADRRAHIESTLETIRTAIMGPFMALEVEQLALVAAALPVFVKGLQKAADQLLDTSENGH